MIYPVILEKWIFILELMKHQLITIANLFKIFLI